MASPRITKDMRENIVCDTIDHQFKSELDAIKAEEAKLAVKVYEARYTAKQRDAMAELGDKFVNTSDDLYVNLDGKRRQIRFGRDAKKAAIVKHVDRNSWSDPFAPTGKLKTELDDFFDRKDDLEERTKKAKLQLMAVLESVQSFKKLRAVWPQGEKFYDMYDVDSETKSGVPAVVITDLNKALGLK